jgi:hypothetical protein
LDAAGCKVGWMEELLLDQRCATLFYIDDDADRSPTHLRRPVGLMEADSVSDKQGTVGRALYKWPPAE